MIAHREKIKIRGLVSAAGWIFIAWGTVAALAGMYHSFWGEPEANLYSLTKWEFVTREQWLRWSGFEMAYGLACAGLGLACREFSKRLPEWVLRSPEGTSGFFE